MGNISVKNQSSLGLSWFAGWLFTIGFLKLAFWKGLLALIVWPYYIGVYVSTLVKAQP